MKPEVTARTRGDEDLLAEARGRLLGEGRLGGCAIEPDGLGVFPRAAPLFPEGSSGTIQIHVDGGVIYLWGEVSSLADRRLAAQIVSRVPGCRGVVNRLTIASPAPGLPPA